MIKLFLILYLIFKEKYNEIPVNSLIKHFMTTILKKYNSNSINDLIINILPNKTDLSSEQIQMITKIKEDFPYIFYASEMNKISKIGAYLSFSLSEFYDYVNSQFSDGVSSFQVKMAINDKQLIDEQLNILKKYLSKYK